MKPFAKCPAASLRRIAGVLTDIDDTLTADGAIAPAALAALGRLEAAGVPVIAITGRPSGWSEPFVGVWPVRGIVAENGGVLLRREAGALRREFTVDAATRAERWRRLQVCAAAVLAEVPGARLAQDSAGRLTDIAVDHAEFHRLDEAGIAAVVQCMRRHGLTATVSSIHVNGWIGEHDKWSGANWAVPLCSGRRFVPEEWLYVGDSANDQAMFARVALSVGVANLRRVADRMTVLPPWITQAERGEGFAEVAEALLAARG